MRPATPASSRTDRLRRTKPTDRARKQPPRDERLVCLTVPLTATAEHLQLLSPPESLGQPLGWAGDFDIGILHSLKNLIEQLFHA